MIRYTLVHETRYFYGAPVDVSHSIMRLRLRPAPGQTVERQRLSLEPAGQGWRAYTDLFGNPTDYAMIDAPHETLTITARAEIVVSLPPAPSAEASTPWEAVAPALGQRRDEQAILAALCQVPTRATQASPALIAWAADLFTPGRPILALAGALMSRIHQDFAYAAGSTDVFTPVAVAFEQRKGVCQDFAHVALAVLRAKGLPARYVSGYIRTFPPPGQPRLVGADASHAWFAVWDPAVGWVDFDPTNDKPLTEDHVTLAWGRDYADVAPVSGVIMGGGAGGLSVSVDLAPSEPEGGAVGNQIPA